MLPLLAAAFSGRVRFILALTLITSALTIAGAFVSPPGFDIFYVSLNRIFSLLALTSIGGMSAIAVRHILILTNAHDNAVTQRKEMQSTQSLFRIAGRVARLGGWSVDVPEMIVQWSDEVCDIHEVPHGYVPPLENAMDFYAPEWRERLARAFTACVEKGTPYDEEMELITATGKRLWVRTIGEAVRDENGKIIRVHGGFQDLTSIKQAEAESANLSDRLANVLQKMTDAIYILDDEWRFNFLNDEAERFLGRSREDLLGRSVWDMYPEARAGLSGIYETAVRDNRSDRLEYYNPVMKEWFSLNLYPTPNGLAVYFRVITERKEAEAKIRESEERFRIVSQATADVVWDWNLVDNTIWWNEGMRTLFGYGPEKLPPGPESWTDHLHPEDKTRVVNGIHTIIDGNARDWSDEYRFERYDGTYADVIDRGFVMRDETGKAFRMIGSIVDVTEKRKLEAQLRQSQRLDAIGQLTGGVAHDFNNLLTVILGNAETLADKLHGNEKLHALADMTRMAAERGAALTNRLLAFARRQALDPKATNVNKLLSEMDPLLRRTLGEHIEIETVRGGGLWNALIDAPQLVSALLNLCINARDAMVKGGRLTIETGNVHLDGDYASQHSEVGSGQYVMIAVSDTGTGMTSDILARAFDPFFTTKDVGKGSGLGLSMVYGFAKQSRGHVKIYSEFGHGTTVKLYLPRAPGDHEESFPTSSSELPRGQERIFLVEDDELVRMHVTRQLESLGYHVTSAHNGAEALEALKRNGDYDLLFTDVVMPGGVNGRQLAVAVAELYPNLPVLFTSGYTENAIVHHGRLDPGVHLLNKPYRLQDLAAKIRLALAQNGKS